MLFGPMRKPQKIKVLEGLNLSIVHILLKMELHRFGYNKCLCICSVEKVVLIRKISEIKFDHFARCCFRSGNFPRGYLKYSNSYLKRGCLHENMHAYASVFGVWLLVT